MQEDEYDYHKTYCKNTYCIRSSDRDNSSDIVSYDSKLAGGNGGKVLGIDDFHVIANITKIGCRVSWKTEYPNMLQSP